MRTQHDTNPLFTQGCDPSADVDPRIQSEWVPDRERRDPPTWPSPMFQQQMPVNVQCHHKGDNGASKWLTASAPGDYSGLDSWDKDGQ
jgi:hypothetical protein